ncbi:MAG: 16S rRNA (uracil(1498)-N(3))-methyltransferase [Treponema sp.]|nr:16S rRNA (uracil(1498)-N(3))-methyltransferase [Treponema sp.]
MVNSQINNVNLILFNDSELCIEEYPAKAECAEVTVFLSRHDERAVHLLKVLHKTVGSSFDAGVLGGKTGNGVISEITATGLRAVLNLDTDPPSRTPLRLGVGFPRPIQLRRLLRDCSSLGLAAVDLIATELGEKSYRDTKLLDDGGAHAALVEGAIQARDTRLPELAVYSSLNTWLQKDLLQRRQGTKSNTEFSNYPHPSVPPCLYEGSLENKLPKITPNIVLLAADNVSPRGSFSELKPFQKDTEAVLAVGSERGWSNREREQLESAGFLRLSLGKRALRTETACTAAAVLVMDKMGLLG